MPYPVASVISVEGNMSFFYSVAGFKINSLERIYGYQGWNVGGRDRLGVWDWHVHTAMFKIKCLSVKKEEINSLFLVSSSFVMMCLDGFLLLLYNLLHEVIPLLKSVTWRLFIILEKSRAKSFQLLLLLHFLSPPHLDSNHMLLKVCIMFYMSFML